MPDLSRRRLFGLGAGLAALFAGARSWASCQHRWVHIGEAPYWPELGAKGTVLHGGGYAYGCAHCASLRFAPDEPRAPMLTAAQFEAREGRKISQEYLRRAHLALRAHFPSDALTTQFGGGGRLG